MRRADKIIFWSVILLSLLSLVFSNVLLAPYGKSAVIIEVNGKQYARYETESPDIPKTLKIKTEHGYNTVEITKEGVAVLDADCKDRQCIGKISKIGEIIVCLPHRLIIKLEGITEVDGVAY